MIRIGDVLDTVEKIRAYDGATDEAAFHADLIRAFERHGWRWWHEVWATRGTAALRRIDFVVAPPADWPHAEAIPALGIEAKMNHQTGTHMTEFQAKLPDYVAATDWRPTGGGRCPAPALILYATPFSVGLERAVFDWRDKASRRRVLRATEHLGCGKCARAAEGAIDLMQLEAISHTIERQLWKLGAAVLRGPWRREFWFRTNRFNAGAPRYGFAERKEAA